MNGWIVRHLLLPTHEWLRGRRTFAFWRQLEVSQWWPRHALLALQTQKLRDLLTRAWDRCPAHRERMAAAGVGREDAAMLSLSELPRLPFLAKQDIREAPLRFVDSSVPGGPIRYTTGGSTGEPLIFYFDRRRQAFDQAARMRTHNWFGCPPGAREVYLWGAPVELRTQDRLKTLRDRLTNQLLLSAFSMSSITMSNYLDAISSYQPDCLFGYPSSLAALAEHAVQTGFQPPRGLRAAFPTGEVLYPHQREQIQLAFQCPVANGYGARDAGFLAHECPFGSMHITAENVIIEIIDDRGLILPPGAEGEIVVTHFDNHALPFIRYRTGDRGALLDANCECGRSLPLLRLGAGRATDNLIATDGSSVHALALIYTLRDIAGVRQFRIVQDAPRHVLVQLIAEATFDSQSDERIRREFRQRLGAGVMVDVERVTDLPAVASGKHRYVMRTF